MKNLKYIFMALASILLITACSDEDAGPIYNSATAKTPTLQALDSASYTLNKTNADNNFATFKFTKANYNNIEFAVKYTLQASIENTFAAPTELGTTTSDSTISVVTSKINGILINNGVEPSTQGTLYFRVISNALGESGKIVTKIDTLKSNVLAVKITPYSTDIVYPKVWVVGDYCGWSQAKSQFLYSYASDSKYQAVVDFGAKAVNGFKLTGADNWDNATGNWGTSAAVSAEASSIQMVNGGNDNITCYSKRYYRLAFDKSTLLLTNDISFDKLAIVGDGMSGWDTDVEMNFDPVKQRFYLDVTLAAGSIKFRADGAWTISFGGSEGILTAGGDNVAVTAGNYRVYVNINNPKAMTYELNTRDYGK